MFTLTKILQQTLFHKIRVKNIHICKVVKNPSIYKDFLTERNGAAKNAFQEFLVKDISF
jgi:IS4 transposase